MFACGGVPDAPVSEGDPQTVAVQLAALGLASIGDAVWDIEVVNGDSQVVWQQRVSSSGYGDSAGSASYVGTCDADPDAADNRVRVWVVGLYSGDVTDAGTFSSGSDTGAGTVTGAASVPFQNPTTDGPLEQVVTCLPNADAAVRFDVTLARPANQGFFDISVNFDDIFCSAKLDCLDGNGNPIRLLFNDDGDRDTTLVMGLACTGGAAGAATALYRDDVVLDCGAAGSATVDPSAGPGNLSPGAGISGDTGLLFGSQVTWGVEQLGFDKAYWNVMLGLAAQTGVCTVSTRATAASGPLAGFSTPAGGVYPFISWSVAITDGDGDLDCAHHPVNGTGDEAGVATVYTAASAPRTFDHELQYAGAPTSYVPPPGDCDVADEIAATWNPADQNPNITLSANDLGASAAGGSFQGVRATVGHDAGKWYFELEINPYASYAQIGVGTASADLSADGGGAEGYVLRLNEGQHTTLAGVTAPISPAPNIYDDTSHRIGVAVDLDANRLYFRSDGVWIGGGDPGAGTGGIPIPDGTYSPLYVGWDVADRVALAALDAGDLTYSVPTGYYAGWYGCP